MCNTVMDTPTEREPAQSGHLCTLLCAFMLLYLKATEINYKQRDQTTAVAPINHSNSQYVPLFSFKAGNNIWIQENKWLFEKH